MPIYDKPVRELLKDFVQDRGIVPGRTFARAEIPRWFREKYPKIKPNTVQAQIITATTNNRTRIYYNADPRNDIFFQTEPGLLRLYESESDPTPIYSAGDSVPKGITEEDEADEAEEATTEAADQFAFEADLKNFLAANLSSIEPGLRLFDRVEGLSGIEFPVGGRYVDILAADRNNDIVVIELKVSRGYDRVIGQLLRYMAWVEQHVAAEAQGVRGIIIARSISQDLVLACSKLQGVALYEYRLSVSLTKVPSLIAVSSTPE